MQLVTVGLLFRLIIPPPLLPAAFPSNVQSVTVGLLVKLFIPPPKVAEFPLNVQSVTIGLLPSLYIPPPKPALPPVMVKPSSTVPGPSPLEHVTTVPVC